MDYLEKARRVISLEMGEVQRLLTRLDASFGEAVETIRRCVENRGKVVVVGVGKSGHIGEKIAATLTSTGSPAVVLNSLNALHGDLGVVADGDVILALSASGETDELINILPALSRFLRAHHRHDRKCGILSGKARSGASGRQCGAGSVSAQSGPHLQHYGHARARRCAGHGACSKPGVFAGRISRAFIPGGRLGRTLLMKVHQIMRGQGPDGAGPLRRWPSATSCTK